MAFSSYAYYLLVFSCITARATAPSGPWDAFNFAPSSRTVVPKVIHSVVGNVQDAQNLIESSGQATFLASNSYVVLDFAQEVGGRLSIQIDSADPGSALSLSFTESSMFINPNASDDTCQSTPSMNSDGVQVVPILLSPTTFTQTIGEQRGGFRYLTVVSNSDSPISISNISLNTTFMPHWENLRSYTGYFLAEDIGFQDSDFLTKIWYGGAYTVQTNTIDSHEARQQPCPSTHGWANNATGGPVSGPILVDGAKRDRNVWPGDMGISVHTELVSTNDLLPTKNSLLVMFSTQDPETGALQYSGPPINAHGSDTYIAWTLIGTHTYFLYTGDLDFVELVWTNYTKALSFLANQLDYTGLIDVPLSFANDWGRDGGQGHNSAANALFYNVLITAGELASQLGETDLAASYSANATAVKAAFNELLWDSAAGMFRDNETTSLHPQDGNSLAVVFNLTNSTSQVEAISEGLTSFWTDIGPVSPELNDTIIPFVGGFELQAHFIAGQGERALDLLHREWAYMFYTNLSVHSTMLEGFTANGSLGYRATVGYEFDYSYTSHSHGWSTGPTPALTFYLVGLKVTSAAGATWSVAPVLSGLSAAEGGFETSLGWFGVKWSLSTNDSFSIAIDAPAGTTGTVTLPDSGSVELDGEPADTDDGRLTVSGGTHVILQRMTS